MKTHPPDKPEFLCGSCTDILCDDCASIAAEYEFLYARQKLQLITAQDQNEKLTAEVANWKRRAEAMEQVAKIGYSDVIQGYIDSLIQKAEASRA